MARHLPSPHGRGGMMGAAKKSLCAAALVLCVPPPQSAAQDWRPRTAEYKAAALRAHNVLSLADDAVHSSNVSRNHLLDRCSRSLSAARGMERRFPDDEQRYPRHSWYSASVECGRHAEFICGSYGRHGSAFQSTREVLAACSEFFPAWADVKSRGAPP